jgi:hypothetical protein
MIANQITIYATCQGDGIKHYIEKYLSNIKYNVIRNYQLVAKGENANDLNIFRHLLKKTDIFIYQEMPKKWGMYSTDLSIENNILSYLPKHCIKIVIPYVYADWLWGLAEIIKRDGTPHFDEIGGEADKCMKYINKELIFNMKDDGFNLNYILRLYNDNKLNFNYDERREKGINILKSKEKTCDVKVSDYILENYKKEKLFYTPNHPSPIILKLMAKQILTKLNISHLNFDKMFENNNYYINFGKELLHLKADVDYYKFNYKVGVQNNQNVHNIIKKIYLQSTH